MINGLAVIGETGGAVRHKTFTLRGAHGLAEVSFAGFAELTLAALCGVERDHMVAGLQAGDAFTHFHHHTAPFVAEHRREYAFRIVTGQGKRIGMANAGVGNFDQHFAFLRRSNINFNDFQRLAWAERDSCARFHDVFPLL